MLAAVERWLDEGAGACQFNEERFANEMARAVLHFQDKRFFVGCYVVMPNHLHLVIRPRDGHKLEELIGAMKGVVARYVNRELGRNGALWQQECFDRIIRDEEHLFNEVQYIGKNPRLAGLPREKWFRWVHPDWEKAGWGFCDV